MRLDVIMNSFKMPGRIFVNTVFRVFGDQDSLHSLIIPEVFRTDAGRYTAKIENEAGYASSTAELMVDGKIHFSDFINFLICSSCNLQSFSLLISYRYVIL